ncbi:MAG: SGNH/GDSL hydrolase family protein [Verrucomicrobiota bacterium]
MSIPFDKNDLILFTGDSITDCGRNRDDAGSLGTGYAHMVAGYLGFKHAELGLRFRNTGISGDSTHHLIARWDKDCIDIQPDWVSILVGINNTWRRYDSNDPTSDELFESECRTLLDRIKNETKARIILCSPFLLHINESISRMREDLDPKIVILKKLAEEYEAIWVDFDAAFADVLQRQAPSYWASDGIHPTAAGHALMADAWLCSAGDSRAK